MDKQFGHLASRDDLHVAVIRDDGAAYGTPTWIWSVAFDGSLYVRPYHGQASRWYRAAVRNHVGRVTSDGATVDVLFRPAAATAFEQIDNAYRTKYAGSPYLAPMLADGPRAATLEIVPRFTTPKERT